MSYDIRLIRDINESLYLFDTSLWLKILMPPVVPDSSKIDLRYLGFFEKFKTAPGQPKVAMTSLIVSEIINRWVRDYGMNVFFKENPAEHKRFLQGSDYTRKLYFKHSYRPSEHYKKTYRDITNELLNFESFCTCVHDEFGCEILFSNALSMQTPKLDFNDNYYILLAKAKKIPIVTDDKDFFVEGVTILTYNKDLYEKGKNAIKPFYKGNSIADYLSEVQKKKVEKI